MQVRTEERKGVGSSGVEAGQEQGPDTVDGASGQRHRLGSDARPGGSADCALYLGFDLRDLR